MAHRSRNGNGNGAALPEEPKGIGGFVRKLMGKQPDQPPEVAGASLQKDLEDVIGEHEGTSAAFSPTQREILGKLVEFGRLRVDDVMVPRADIIALDIETSFEEAMTVFQEAAHSRLPVYRGTLDDPIGMVHIKDMMAVLAEAASDEAPRELPNLQNLARDVLCVPPSMPLADLLVRMQSTRIHMALVIDEYGGTDGLLTIEDLIEEVVGEIEDEHDVDTSPRLIRVPDGTFVVDARLEIPEFEEKTGLELIQADWDEDVDTMGGLVFSLLGRVPQRGEVVRHPAGLELQVVDADPRRVKRIRVLPAQETGDPGESPGESDGSGRGKPDGGHAVAGDGTD